MSSLSRSHFDQYPLIWPQQKKTLSKFCYAQGGQDIISSVLKIPRGMLEYVVGMAGKVGPVKV